MVTTLGYMSKLPSDQIKCYHIMNSPLRKFAGCYLLAHKMSLECANRGTINAVSNILGLDPETLINLEKELLASINFCL